MSNGNSHNSNRALTIQLNRKVYVKRYPIIARVTFNRARPDLVSLLESIEGGVENMPPRLKVYLKKENLWDEDASALTSKGESVKASGLYAATERGLYHIWYTNNDPLLGTRPVLMQRDTAFFEPDSSSWLKGEAARYSDFRVDAQREIELIEEVFDGQSNKQIKNALLLSKIEPEVVCSPEKEAALDLRWELSQTASMVNLSGQLDILSFHKLKSNNKPEKIDTTMESFSGHLPSVMECIAGGFEGAWDQLDERIAVSIKSIQQYPKAINHFSVGSKSFSGFKTSYGNFESLLVKNLPIKPANQLDAEQWHQKWLEDFYAKSYQTSVLARQQQVQWLDSLPLSSFELGLKDGTTLLGSLTKEKTVSSYWHVAAMADLTPTKSKKLMMPISLVNGERLDLQSLFNQLSGGNNVDRVIYSDRYVHTNRQTENLNTVSESLCVSDGLLMTLGKQSEKEVKLPNGWTRETFEKKHDNHGRYWVLAAGLETYCWECTIGLDFIRKTDSGVYVDGTPGFTPKEVSELPQYLQNTISEIMNLEVA